MDLGDLVPGTGEAQLGMTVDYSAFGEPVDVELPEPSEVTDVTRMMTGAAASGDKSSVYG
jgi:hypothetical protein